ncbi:MAG TPA: tetratricopeptide repeat protein, partial [Candidatus Dormibacteraeota bacterium]|nr:tetratricopeptide repeat protein [Candidatus Dormibacteraeota bacterium]
LLALLVVPLAVFPILADGWYVNGRADLAVRVDPLQSQYHWAVGTIPELRRASELGETDPGLYVQLGDAERQAGDTAAAKRAYLRALEIDPYYGPAFDRLQALGG